MADDVYPWAGEIRTVAIAKGGTLFALPQHIRSAAHQFFDGLNAENRLRGLSLDRFVKRLAQHLSDVNALHPFREGNGRAQRAFFSQVASDAGWHLAWNRVDADEHLRASIASTAGDTAAMEVILHRITEPED